MKTVVPIAILEPGYETDPHFFFIEAGLSSEDSWKQVTRYLIEYVPEKTEVELYRLTLATACMFAWYKSDDPEVKTAFKNGAKAVLPEEIPLARACHFAERMLRAGFLLDEVLYRVSWGKDVFDMASSIYSLPSEKESPLL